MGVLHSEVSSYMRVSLHSEVSSYMHGVLSIVSVVAVGMEVYLGGLVEGLDGGW